MRVLTALLVALGLRAAPALARDLEVEVEVLHLAGLLTPAELDARLADPRLAFEAGYQPERPIAGGLQAFKLHVSSAEAPFVALLEHHRAQLRGAAKPESAALLVDEV